MTGRRGNRSQRGDAGETLIELLMAMSIMGVTLAAVLGLIATSIMMSDLHHKQTTAGAAVRNYAEAVETRVASGSYDITGSPASYSPGTVGFTVPSGFTASVSSVVCLNDAAVTMTACGTGGTVQKVALTVASTDSKAAESLIVIVRQQP